MLKRFAGFTLLVAVALLLPAVGNAAIINLVPPDPAHNLSSLEHGQYSVWEFKSMFGTPIGSAKLTFLDIYNDGPESGDQLSVHLINNPSIGLSDPAHTNNWWNYSGPESKLHIFTDIGTGGDIFEDGRWGSQTLLFRWFNEPPTDASHIPTSYENRKTMEYVFTGDQLAILNSYISDGGTFAFGFDPDCRYINSGIILEIDNPYTPVPEPGTMLLLGTGLIGLARWGRSRTKM